MPEREVDAMLDPLPLTVVPADKAPRADCRAVADGNAEVGLSLGDRFSAWHSRGATVCPHGPATRTGRRSPTPSRSRLSRSADFGTVKG